MAFEVGDEVFVTEKLAVNGYPHLYAELMAHVGTVAGVDVYGPADNERTVYVRFARGVFAPPSGYGFSTDEIVKKGSDV